MNKEKSLLKRLKKEASALEPNLRSFIQKQFSPRPKPNWGKIFSLGTFFASVMVLVLLIGQSVPLPSSSIGENSSGVITSSIPTSSTTPTSSSIELPPLRLQSDQAAISISSVTSATLFLQTDWATPMNAPAIGLESALTRNGPQLNFDETMTLLKPYLALFEQIIGQGSVPLVEETISDLPEYEFLSSFVMYDINGVAIPYQLYFNLTIIDTIETEDFYTLEGQLIIANQAPLSVTGSKTIENEETTIRFRTELDNDNYIATRYQMEENETKISVTQSVAGQLNVSLFKLEVDGDETVVALMFLEDNNESRIRDRFRFEYELEDDERILEIKFDVTQNGQRIKGKITVVVVAVLDDFGNIIGFVYQASQFNEDGEKEGEWQDHRDRPHDETDHDDDEEDDEDEDEEDDRDD